MIELHTGSYFFNELSLLFDVKGGRKGCVDCFKGMERRAAFDLFPFNVSFFSFDTNKIKDFYFLFNFFSVLVLPLFLLFLLPLSFSLSLFEFHRYPSFHHLFLRNFVPFHLLFKPRSYVFSETLSFPPH